MGCPNRACFEVGWGVPVCGDYKLTITSEALMKAYGLKRQLLFLKYFIWVGESQPVVTINSP